jgi:hexosaminidase
LEFFSLIVCLIIFLFIYYNILAKKQIKQEKELESRAMVINVPSDSINGTKDRSVLNLIPVPKKVKINKGYFLFPATIVYSVPESLKSEVERFLKILPLSDTRYSAGGGNILFRYKSELPVQGYTLDIGSDKIIIEYSNPQGLYYGIISLKVLNQNYSGKIPCVYVEDSPDLAVRGLMLDISRDKVPTKETLMSIAGSS